MATVAVLAALFCVPQLHVEPNPAEVGGAIVVIAGDARAPAVGTEVAVAIDGGAETPVGTTGTDGRLTFVPARPGLYVFTANIADVRCIVPAAVRPVRPTWLLALASVPLGLALLWWNLRALIVRPTPDRRGS